MVGSISATAGREEFVVNAKCVNSELARTVDILGDILQNSTFDEKVKIHGHYLAIVLQTTYLFRMLSPNNNDFQA